MNAAEKGRDSLAKGLYNKLFGHIIQHINGRLSVSSSNNSIGILDIAGFGRFQLFYYRNLALSQPFCARSVMIFFRSPKNHIVSNFKICLLLFRIEYLTEVNNTFEQLCINYVNERVQSFYVHIKLSEEKQWYVKQGLDVPFVEFFDNSHIVGMGLI